MSDRHKKDLLIPLLTVTFDIIAIEFSFLFSYWFRFYTSFTKYFEVIYGIPPIEEYIYTSFIIMPILLWLLHRRNLYKPRRGNTFTDEFVLIVRIVIIGLLVLMTGAFFYRTFSYSRLVVGILGITLIVFLSISRFIVIKFEQWWYAQGKDLRRIAIIGCSDTALKIYDSISKNSKLGYKPLGYCTIDGNTNNNMGTVPYLGQLSSVPIADIIKSHHIDVLLIALSEREHTYLSDLVRNCQGLNVEIMMVPDILDLMTSHVKIKHIEGIPFLGIKSPSLSTWNFIIKRLFDLIFTSIILLIISPFFLLIALLIKLESKGSIFYLQERVGINGEKFKLIKFRSMRTDAEVQTGPVWSHKNDPRTTKLGKFLRRFSIDELPQLVNVLKGEMSIVGPRPERPFFVEQFKGQIPRYLERHRVKTGMTGWAQVNGLRGGDASIIERTKYDIYYIENWSLIFDIKIILRTTYAVLFGKDAY